ncbi:hypothetical protein ACHAWU_010048 [Discostella pseudostelligera]|uniref:Uncharacterized protein n=1 Tax=Discostella pseudostelligera TaxID=259834 RepID=A0ABD3N785_9STRA
MAATIAAKASCLPYPYVDDDDDDDIDMVHDAATNTPMSSTPPSPGAPTPLLSILNVVVDHVMMSPSPLEPKEFEHLEAEAMNGQQKQQKHLHLQPDECSGFGEGHVGGG